MKRKPSGSNFKTILSFLNEAKSATAAQIRKATRVKGNIYVTLKTMVDKKFIQRQGKMYGFFDAVNNVSPQPETKINPHGALIDTLVKELNYVEEGIATLEITRNYLVRRIEFLKNA